MERISTGVQGLNALLGGYPRGRSVLVSGPAGSGKTILALHFVNARCSEGERCGYVAIEESKEDLCSQATQFGWDFRRYEHEGILQFYPVLEERMIEAKYQFNRFSSDYSFTSLLEIIDEDTHNLVIDNLGVMALDMDPSQFRQQLDFLVYSLGKRNCTTLIVSDETLLKEKRDVALYSVHGAIRLMKRDNPYTDTRDRVMEVVKMRSSPAPIDYIIFEIGDSGIEIVST